MPTLLWTLSSCALLALTYVLSLYVWRSPHHRDHPEMIKRRFTSAFFVLLVSPLFPLYLGGHAHFAPQGHSLWTIIGLRWAGLGPAIVYPLLLTMALFLGPLAMMYSNDARRKMLSIPQYWTSAVGDLIWWRNHIVAPFSEEFTFRACMLPILLGYFSSKDAVIVSPLFFGIAHLHHMIERIRQGQEVKSALLISLFQMTYTTVFGMYSAYLFVRTGHLATPVVVHGFCNFMGFPDLAELWQHPMRKRIILMGVHVLGVVLFYLLLFPMTENALYQNVVYAWP